VRLVNNLVKEFLFCTIVGAVIILLTFVLASAFTPDKVYPSDIKTAVELCESNGGWAEIRHQNGATRALTCANTAKFSFQLDAKE